MNIDDLIYIRSQARENKDWEQSDSIRNYLDNQLIFVIDTKNGQEVYHLNKDYFKYKDKNLETFAMTNRQYLEHNIKKEINANKNFDAWIFSKNN